MFAAQNGHLEVLQWLRAQDPPCPWDSSVCSSAAHKGQLEVLQWARARERELQSYVGSSVT